MLAGGTQCPGLAALMRRTKYPGVHRLSGGRYRVRFVARDPKTGREKEIKKVIEAASGSAAMEVGCGSCERPRPSLSAPSACGFPITRSRGCV